MPSFWTRFGLSAESAAVTWLKSSGFRILDRNWRRPWGELDIVALKDGAVHFIEVKAAAAAVPGFEPYHRAGREKMAKVRRTARSWLAANGYGPDTPWQMDIISVIMDSKGTRFEHFENI